MRPSKKSYKIGLLLSQKREQRKIAPERLAPIEVASKVKSNKFKYRGALTPGSIKFKRVIVASFRANIAALEEASNTSSLTNDKSNLNADTLVSAIMSLSAAAAKKYNATIAIIASETATAKGLDKKDDLKVAELQLRVILWNAKSNKSYVIGLLLSQKKGAKKIAPARLAPIEVASKVKSNKFKYRGR